jgi:hypothetical protein
VTQRQESNNQKSYVRQNIAGRNFLYKNMFHLLYCTVLFSRLLPVSTVYSKHKWVPRSNKLGKR